MAELASLSSDSVYMEELQALLLQRKLEIQGMGQTSTGPDFDRCSSSTNPAGPSHADTSEPMISGQSSTSLEPDGRGECPDYLRNAAYPVVSVSLDKGPDDVNESCSQSAELRPSSDPAGQCAEGQAVEKSRAPLEPADQNYAAQTAANQRNDGQAGGILRYSRDELLEAAFQKVEIWEPEAKSALEVSSELPELARAAAAENLGRDSSVPRYREQDRQPVGEVLDQGSELGQNSGPAVVDTPTVGHFSDSQKDVHVANQAMLDGDSSQVSTTNTDSSEWCQVGGATRRESRIRYSRDQLQGLRHARGPEWEAQLWAQVLSGGGPGLPELLENRQVSEPSTLHQGRSRGRRGGRPKGGHAVEDQQDKQPSQGKQPASELASAPGSESGLEAASAPGPAVSAGSKAGAPAGTSRPYEHTPRQHLKGAAVWLGRVEAEEWEEGYEVVPAVARSGQSQAAEPTGASKHPGETEWDEDDWEEESEDEPETFQSQALAVAGEPDFDSGPPIDGLEFLRRVRYERERCPKVVVAPLDPTTLPCKQTNYMPAIPEVASCPPELLPSGAWATAFLAEFSDLRLSLAQLEVPSGAASADVPLPPVRDAVAWHVFCFGARGEETVPAGGCGGGQVEGGVEQVERREGEGGDGVSEAEGAGRDDEGEADEEQTVEIEGGSRDESGETNHDAVSEVEGIGEREGVGEAERGGDGDGDEIKLVGGCLDLDLNTMEETCAEASGLDDGDGLDMIGATDTAETNMTSGDVASTCVVLRHQPLLGIVLQLDEVSRAQLLRHHARWLTRVDRLTEDRATWLFALAAVVDKPLDADTSAAFRSILRKCAELRAAKEARDDPELPLLNVLITIAGRYFGQAESYM